MAIVQESIRAITRCHFGPTRWGNMLARWAQLRYADSLELDERNEIIAAHLDRGLRMKVVPTHHIGGTIYWRGAYAHRILNCIRPYLRPESTLVDVGANQGEVTLFAARRLTTGRVIAFEPVQANFERLRANVELNGLTNVTACDYCLGAAPGQVELFVPCDVSAHHRHGWNEGLTSMYGGGAESQRCCQVAVRSLDEVVSEMDIERLDVLKIDVEGAELPVLRGAAESLRRFRPVIVVEMNAETFGHAGYRAKDLCDYLRERSYDGYLINRAGRRGRPILEQLPDHCDALWIPRNGD